MTLSASGSTVSGFTANTPANGVWKYYYSIDNDDAQEYTDTITINTDTNAVYSFWAVSASGVASQKSSFEAKVRKTPYVATITESVSALANGWYTAQPTLTISLTQSEAAGLDENLGVTVHYALTDASGANTTAASFTVTGSDYTRTLTLADGIYTLDVWTTDAADNTFYTTRIGSNPAAGAVSTHHAAGRHRRACDPGSIHARRRHGDPERDVL